MCGLRSLFIALLSISLGESRLGTIINFDPPDLNDWVERVVVKEDDVRAKHNDGTLVSNPKLARFSMTLEQYCYESSDVPKITPSQWYQPPKMECRTGRYFVLRLLYNGFVIDCLRITTDQTSFALKSVKPIVNKRFFLKVYYLTTVGDCYVKYFELPVTECSAERHIKLGPKKCEKIFPTQYNYPFMNFLGGVDDEVSVKVVSAS